ncbi:MAG: hypothetical protein K8L97_17355 [Anaerolineae bacterium]|nr:hypothetical protein [Anaerolineae bacterium]
METPSSSENPRRNRARERHERRKHKLPITTPVNTSRQLKPSGGFKIPQIRIPVNWLILYGMAGAAFLLVVIFLIGRLKNETPTIGNNAIWLGTQYTYDTPDDAQVTELVQKLRDNQVGIVYAWVGLLQPNNAWSEVAKFNQVETFAEQIKRLYPEVQLYGWLSIGAQGEDGNNRLGDANLQQLVADFSLRVVTDFGFDGVALNVVPITGSDENYLGLLRKIRGTIGEDMPMAVAVPPDWTPTDTDIALPSQIAPGTVWPEEYKQRVALLADQIVVTGYNSGLDTAEDYATWVAYQVQAFAGAMAALDTTTQILIGVPTYDAQPPMHDPAVENVQSAIQGIRDGMTQAGEAASYISGIAIYAEWQTTDSDWANIKLLWVR